MSSVSTATMVGPRDFSGLDFFLGDEIFRGRGSGSSNCFGITVSCVSGTGEKSVTSISDSPLSPSFFPLNLGRTIKDFSFSARASPAAFLSCLLFSRICFKYPAPSAISCEIIRRNRTSRPQIKLSTSFKEMPVISITPSSTKKHKNMAQPVIFAYLSKTPASQPPTFPPAEIVVSENA